MKDVLVIDLEATCWEGGQQPKSQPSEIIEIGYQHVFKRSGWEFGLSGSILVKPRYSVISEFCTRLTGHTQKHTMDFGMTLEEAAKEIAAMAEHEGFDPKRCVWSSWGMYDYRMLKAEMASFFPLSHLHLNAKALFSAMYGKKGTGLAKALEFVGWEFEGLQHRANNDAYNAARLLVKMLGG